MLASCGTSPPMEGDLAARWETPSPNIAFPNCSPVDRARIAPVTSEARGQAISRLADASVIPLGEDELSRFLTAEAAESMEASGDGSLRPFLVRAVAKNDAPTFLAYVCGDLLVVLHGSLGRSTPPSRRAPLVILLDRLPAQTAVLWEIAE